MAKAQFPAEQALDGAFVRQKDVFCDWVSADGHTGCKAEPGRYHLYVSLACPWASRIVIVRALLGLEDAIGMTVVDPIRDERGWAFRDGPGYSRDPINGFAFLREAYLATDPSYRQRVTVPVLWDTKNKRIVSNNDDDIMRMLETEFNAFAKHWIDLYPTSYRQEIDEFNEWIFQTVNDGVYRAGFATSQAAYERAARRVFETLDELEERLSARRYLFASMPLETDWRLFVTLVRFDPVYYVHFKCNVRLIAQYPNLFGYLRDLYQISGIAATVNFDHIKRHYYVTHDDINPTGLVPIGPSQDLLAPPGRESLP
ncbi:MAG: glutathione S-transferase family protein [Candidatus Eremiobacteraeota bacterium]|nr:glutathione S-transferase family protein [Candidatus Eremiobacteraeota bacterium]MBV8366143.1 glutathione S-transferase family protein [Candidatus Eremiobacteraeota bacterium]